jgi:GNAT superfamily N-acetyltransferase
MIREIDHGEGPLVAEVLHELRSHLGPAQIPALIDAQRADGYRVVASFDDGTAVAAAGFRVTMNLALGRNLEVDDLVAPPRARRAGHARDLLAWLTAEASDLGCRFIHLDSNTDRHAAHHLYFAAGFHITSFHFGQAV